MCQLQHANIVSAQDIYLPCDIPVEHRSSTLRLQMRRSCIDHICVRMPYYPADMSWLIHSSTQVLTPEHVQVKSLMARTTCCLQRHTPQPLSANSPFSEISLQYICVQILSGLRCCHHPSPLHSPTTFFDAIF
jgi:hypothetical protein